MTPTELQQAYLDHLRRQGRSGPTLDLNRRWLQGYFAFCADQGVRELAELTGQHLTDYHQSLLWRSHSKGRRYSPNSLYQMQQMLRAFLRWALLHGHLETDLAAGLVLPRPPQLPLPLLSRVDLERLHEQLEPETPLGLRDRALLAVFYRAGLSKEQAQRLDLADVQLRARQLVLRRLHRPRQEVLLDDDLAEILSAYLWHGRPRLNPRPGEVALFLSRDGVRMCSNAMSLRMHGLGERAGLSQALNPRLLNRSGRAHREAGKSRELTGEA